MKYKNRERQIKDAAAVLHERLLREDQTSDYMPSRYRLPPTHPLRRDTREDSVRWALNEMEKEYAEAEQADKLRPYRKQLKKVGSLIERLSSALEKLPKQLKEKYTDAIEALRTTQRAQINRLPAKRIAYKERAAICWAAKLIEAWDEWPVGSGYTSQLCRLAAILYGDSDKDLKGYAAAYLKEIAPGWRVHDLPPQHWEPRGTVARVRKRTRSRS